MLAQNPEQRVLFKEVKAVKAFYAKVTDENGGSTFRLVDADEVVTLGVHVANEVLGSSKAILVEDVEAEEQVPVPAKPRRGRPPKEA